MFRSLNFSVKHHHKSTKKKKNGPNPQTEQGLRTAEKTRRTARRTGANLRRAPETSRRLHLRKRWACLIPYSRKKLTILQKRTKFEENAFPNIYQKLYEAPDPYPALTSIAELDTKISELESENRKMKVELEERMEVEVGIISSSCQYFVANGYKWFADPQTKHPLALLGEM
ncbi:hypothetical protein Cgig2_013339 [Carnegiea gigantea]|uniref:Cux N-terminal domain-containing protein n=1 Tax=Carnegiea gigantea TaxID=171969 RepID=A0A9Q1JEX5_9CARY|nr:hypothetical protein Cgig2_013339 [Carnegiea gigantea]